MNSLLNKKWLFVIGMTFIISNIASADDYFPFPWFKQCSFSQDDFKGTWNFKWATKAPQSEGYNVKKTIQGTYVFYGFKKEANGNFTFLLNSYDSNKRLIGVGFGGIEQQMNLLYAVVQDSAGKDQLYIWGVQMLARAKNAQSLTQNACNDRRMEKIMTLKKMGQKNSTSKNLYYLIKKKRP